MYFPSLPLSLPLQYLQSINKTWKDGGKTGMGDEDTGGVMEGWEAASPNQTIFNDNFLESCAPGKSWTENIWFDLTIQKNAWWCGGILAEEKVHIEGSKHDINKCTITAPSWRPFLWWSFIQINCRSKLGPIRFWWLCSRAVFHPFSAQSLISTLPPGFSCSHHYIPVQREWSCQVPDSGHVFALFLYQESHIGREFNPRWTHCCNLHRIQHLMILQTLIRDIVFSFDVKHSAPITLPYHDWHH